MKRNSALKVLNPILGLLLLNQLLTGLMGGMLPREAFAAVHKGGGIVLASAVSLHVILNWNWIKANFFRAAS